MSYEVLARRRRPQSFEEMVGQEHVLRPLQHALTTGNVPQAILFSGGRGIGKTTLARVLTRCLNCEKGVSPKPCGECSNCQEIVQGRHLDLTEVDAASRTQVDEMRNLLETTHYVPAKGKFRVYLIDEVHMLSTHSFNALLKTLEEPPGHVVFLLATTDPEKIPRTVISRCLQFHLKALSLVQLRHLLTTTLTDEKTEFDSQSIDLLARAATGSARDALTLAEQAIAHGGGALRGTEVAAMLGSLDPKVVVKLLRAIASESGGTALDLLQSIAQRDLEPSSVLEAIQRKLHSVAVTQVVPDAGQRRGRGGQCRGGGRDSGARSGNAS